MQHTKRKITLTKEQSTDMALFFQAGFLGVLAAKKVEDKFMPLLQEFDEYRTNFKNVKYTAKRLYTAAQSYYQNVFCGIKVEENKQRYQELADKHLGYRDLVLEFSIKNQFHFYNVDNTDFAAISLQAWLLCSVALILIENGKIDTLAKRVGVYKDLQGMQKFIEDISKILDVRIPTPDELEQVTNAFAVFENKYLANEELLMELLQINGLDC